MRSITILQNLVYYDQPILFTAKDKFGVYYICTLIDSSNMENQYFCLPVTQSRLSQLLRGEIDLNIIFKEPESEEYYQGSASDRNLENITIKPIMEIPEQWYPKPGVYVKLERDLRDLLVEQSNEKQRAIIHCSLNPPEAITESKITADNLSNGIRLFQRLIKYSYERVIKNLSLRNDILSSIQSPRNYTLEVFATAGGSFTLHMQTVEPADLLGYSNISRALEIIDKLNSFTDSPENIIDEIAPYGGHLVSAYKDMLKYIEDTNTSLSYKWTMPSKKDVSKCYILPRQAKEMYKVLVKRIGLTKEILVLSGRFSKVDEESGKWRLVTAELKKFSGESRISLAGIVIESKTYELHCEEILEYEPAKNRENKKLEIVSITAL